MARLTPRDIQEKEFSSGFRGYKEQDVDEFLDRVTASYEEVFKENIDLKEEVDRLVEENKKYELIGERMQAALVAAQETADDVRKNATKEAENILREAEIKAHKLVQASRDQHRELQKSLAVVKQIEEEFRFKLKSTLQSYLKLLEEVALGDKKEIQKWILPEDMTVLDERRRDMESAAKPAPTAPAPLMASETGIPGDTGAMSMPAETASSDDTGVMEAADKPVAKKEAPAPANDAKVKVDEPAIAEAEKAAAAAEKAALDAKAEDAKAKAAALMEEIAQQAAAAEKEEKASAAKAKAGKEAKEEAAKPPFDTENAKASAVTPEWAKLQEAVAEAVKDAGKPGAAKAEAPKAEAPKAEAPKAEAPKAEAPKAEAPKAEAPKAETPKAETPKAEAKTESAKTEAKAEAKEAKAKTNLDDIEIVEDESFWKDI